MIAETEEPQFSLGVPPTGALLLGLTGPQLAAWALAAMVVVASLWVRLTPLVPTAAVALAGTYSWARVGGQPLYRWAPAWGRHASRVGMGRWWRAPIASHTADGSGRRLPVERVSLPAELGRPQWIELDGGGPPVGFLIDGRGRSATATMVFALDAPASAALGDSGDRGGLVAGWAAVLNLSAARPLGVRHLMVVERARPPRSRPPCPPSTAAPEMTADYERLTEQVQLRTMSHEVFLAAQFHLPHRRMGDVDAAADLGMGVRALAAQLATAGVAATPLSIVALAALVRSYSSVGVACGGPEGAAPPARCVRFDHLQAAGWSHRSFAVQGWPRTPLTLGWLQPLLDVAPAGCVRTLAVHYQPVAPHLAVRRARAARTKATVDAANRRRLGVLDSVAETQAGHSAGGREAELVAGHTEHRVAAVVLISAPTAVDLETASTAVTAAATAAGLDLRVLHGRQDQGWAAAMPLCRLRLAGGG